MKALKHIVCQPLMIHCLLPVHQLVRHIMKAGGWAYEIWDLRISVPALVSNMVLPDRMRRLFERPTFRPHQFRGL
jgi:hypothetical protein